MTALQPNLVNYEGSFYYLVASGSIIKPKKFGLFPKTRSSTANPGGFLFTLMIVDGCLLLDSVSCMLGAPKGWLHKLKYKLGKYPPQINGVKPTIEEYDFPDNYQYGLKFPYDIYYSHLSLRLKYTGKLVAVDSPNELLDIDPDDRDSFTELITFMFEKGKLKSLERIKGNAPTIPRPLPPPRSSLPPLKMKIVQK